MLRATEKLLWIVAGAATIYGVSYVVYGAFSQQLGEREFVAVVAPGAPARERIAPQGAAVGRVRIPRLAISAVIFEGTTESELRRGVGHWTGSPMDESGNVVLAAHRDTFFQGLNEIQIGDEITLEAAAGNFSYTVSGTAVVWPSAVEVLQPTGSPTLTLVTCYPFEFFGRAPQRFIVRAQK